MLSRFIHDPTSTMREAEVRDEVHRILEIARTSTRRDPNVAAARFFPALLQQLAMLMLLCLPVGCGQTTSDSKDGGSDKSGQSVETQRESEKTRSGEPLAGSPRRDEEDQQWTPQIDPEGKINSWGEVEDFNTELAIFRSVFWEPDDTASLRKLIREGQIVRGKRVLEIGTGSGLISLCCLKAGAAHVVATDVNQMAISNAIYNARKLALSDRFEVRRVPLSNTSAWAVIGDDERFDYIISNPPWEDQKPDNVADFALYDPGFLLLKTLLEGLDDHLTPDGRVLLAYGCVSAVRQVQKLAPQHGYIVEVLDDRKLDDLPELFLPGMMLELKRAPSPESEEP